MLTFQQLYNLSKPYHLRSEAVASLPIGSEVSLVTYTSELKFKADKPFTYSFTDGVIVRIVLGKNFGRRRTQSWSRKFVAKGSKFGEEDWFRWCDWGITYIIIP